MDASSSRATPLPPFERFPRVSVAMMLALSLLTLGIYGWWWLYSRTAILNTLLPPEQAISSKFVSLVMGGFTAVLIATFFLAAQPDNAALSQAVNLLSLCINILVIVWVFRFRSRMLFLLETGAREIPDANSNVYYLGFLWTFLFSVFYLQYKINIVSENSQTGIIQL